MQRVETRVCRIEMEATRERICAFGQHLNEIRIETHERLLLKVGGALEGQLAQYVCVYEYMYKIFSLSHDTEKETHTHTRTAVHTIAKPDRRIRKHSNIVCLTPSLRPSGLSVCCRHLPLALTLIFG